MTSREALEYARIALWSTRGREAYDALAAVVEDYEKARPLLEAVMAADTEHIAMDENWTELTFTTCKDVGVILRAALAYREGRKP